MAVDVRIVTAVLLIFANEAFAQVVSDRCRYMREIPKGEKPNLPPEQFDGMSWSERPLVPAEERDEVCMDSYHPNPQFNSYIQVILMDEEIEGDVAIAKLNYGGNQTPRVAQFSQGSYSMLGPVIRRIGDDWHLVITQRQDFENPGMRMYTFNVEVDDEAIVVSVTLLINNIDDNAPIIELFQPCEIPELGEVGPSKCVYKVTDADGEISTGFMTYKIESDRGDEEFFELVREDANTWMETYMRVVVKKPLDFANSPLHIFRATALDSLPNNHTVTMMVEVDNVESRPPIWLEIFAVEQFDEKTAKQFRVRAIDGDTGIDKAIHYRLDTAKNDTFFHIEPIDEDGQEGAYFKVDPIDRDFLEREVFELSIIAFKYADNGEIYETRANVIIIVNDINDQRPVPLHKNYHIKIREETAMTLDLTEFGFHDRDLGQHAQYEVHLESVYPPGAHEAFYIAPENGYQQQNFIIGTQKHEMLDYEIPEFQKIRLSAVAIDVNDTRHIGVATIDIDLENWNDEQPMFEYTSQTVEFDETEGKDYHVGKVQAHDRDVGDRVEHSLLGNAVQYLRIDEDTGDIYVVDDDVFDFHRQSELFVQVRASDTLGAPFNTNTSQLVIKLRDINNTPPTLRLPRSSPDVEENVPDGHIITKEIRASDPDTTAELRFEIDWESSYATKQGRDAEAKEFQYCLEIETLYPTINSRGDALGRVVVREIQPGITIDYEMFEHLHLAVRVRDLNTITGDDYDESLLTITIIDMNDNKPIFDEDTVTQEFRVRERSDTGVVIGSIRATDIDGPLYNQVRYTITPKQGTPKNLVDIDFESGQITVKDHRQIDADDPERYFLYYTVVASDECSLEDVSQCPPDKTFHESEVDIMIRIIDTNNRVPQMITNFNKTVYIYENATTGDPVVKLETFDMDRDVIYKNVSYQINYVVNRRIWDFFDVDLITGLVTVEYRGLDALDRDGDEPEHRIIFSIMDNFGGDGDGNRNVVEPDMEITVVLLDVNDNAPELPGPDELSWSISEDKAVGSRLYPDIYAPDIDQPDTDNSRVGYAILSLTAERDIEFSDLFTMIQIQNVTGELEVAKPLKGYWGNYKIHILAYDHGIPKQSSNETYDLVIRPYNYHEPEFVFPQNHSTIRLAREWAQVGGLLVRVDGEFLEHIVATDEDGLSAGVVTFSIAGDTEAEEHFQILDQGVVNSAALSLKQMLTETTQEFQVTIRGTDGGTEPYPKYIDCMVTVVFVPTQGDPVFETNTATVAFIEKEAGLLEETKLDPAADPKNYKCEDDCHEIYYHIIEGNADGHFVLHPRDNVLTLAKELDRSVSQVHRLVVAASNSPTEATGLPGSTVTVTVNVREADPRPYFDREIYTAGISETNDIGRVLLTVQAMQSEDLPVTYTLDETTMVVDPSLQAVQSSAFVLDPDTGVLSLNFQPTGSMHGMFEFDVVATDSNDATDRAPVKVYLITSLNRVSFLFMNSLDQVQPNTDFVASTFSSGFDMTCHIDGTLRASDASGVARDDVTEVRAHFIRDNLPVPADDIEQLRSDTVLLRNIQDVLRTEMLVLRDLVTGDSPVIGADDGKTTTIYVLSALAALLGFLCLLLLITFIIRTRILNRRLEALSMTKYGSVDSGLNRVGITAPGTNKHAVEGSNPIWNETFKAPDFDAMSDVSNDSDLIGIEDLPQFRNDFFPGDTSSTQGIVTPDAVATHDNNFRFNASPFSLELGNTQLRR